MGLYNDLVMRISIPCIFIIMLFVIDSLNRNCRISKSASAIQFKTKTTVIVVGALMLIGTYYPMVDLVSVLSELNKPIKDRNFGSMRPYARRDQCKKLDLCYNYYSYDVDDNLFYRYIARVQY